MLSEFLKRLMFGRQFSMDDGKIRIIGSRHVMYPLQVLKEINAIDRDGMYLAAKKGIIDELNKSPGVIGIKNLHPAYSIVNFFDTMGLGTMTLLNLDIENKEAAVTVLERDFGQLYTEKDKICDTFTAGIIAGIFSFVMSDNVDCRETACMAFGSDCCKFEIRKGGL